MLLEILFLIDGTYVTNKEVAKQMLSLIEQNCIKLLTQELDVNTVGYIKEFCNIYSLSSFEFIFLYNYVKLTRGGRKKMHVHISEFAKILFKIPVDKKGFVCREIALLSNIETLKRLFINIGNEHVKTAIKFIEEIYDLRAFLIVDDSPVLCIQIDDTNSILEEPHIRNSDYYIEWPILRDHIVITPIAVIIRVLEFISRRTKHIKENIDIYYELQQLIEFLLSIHDQDKTKIIELKFEPPIISILIPEIRYNAMIQIKHVQIYIKAKKNED